MADIMKKEYIKATELEAQKEAEKHKEMQIHRMELHRQLDEQVCVLYTCRYHVFTSFSYLHFAVEFLILSNCQLKQFIITNHSLKYACLYI